MQYDLEKRTTGFGKDIINFCKNVKIDLINRSVVSQIIRSGTSIGANYREANGASSKKDFRNKIHICKKEAEETKHWLEILEECDSKNEKQIQILQKECQELVLIFGKIVSKLRN